MVNSMNTSKPILSKVCLKIKKEMKSLSSDQYDSILRDRIEAVKCFSWETVTLDMEKMIPTLLSLLRQVVPQPAKRKPLICFLASLLIKSRHKHMGLVQRATSIMLYGNGSNKQVKNCVP